MSETTPSWSFKATVAPAVEGLKKNWLPFLVIQLISASVAVAYYQVPALQQAAKELVKLKVQGGLFFGFTAGFIAGGVVPEFAKAITGKLRKVNRRWLIDSIFNGIVYGMVGVEVVVFYQYQTKWFGDGNDLRTLATKTFVDMGAFSPLISITTATFMFDLKKHGYNLGKLLKTIDKNYYRDKMLPGLIPCWFFWIPVLFAVYAMPADLQFPLSILAEAAWSILFVFIATNGDEDKIPEPIVP